MTAGYDHNVAVLFSGQFACFTRPEFKIERVSYDMMTPSAARGALESIFWRPDMRWIVDRISLLSPIKFVNVSRYEIAKKIIIPRGEIANLSGDVTNLAKTAHRQKRSSLVLTDAAYIVEARMQVDEMHGACLKKYCALFRRRLDRGQCFQQPYLGCREFVADFHCAKSASETVIPVDRDLGWMLKELKWVDGRAHPVFFEAILVKGILSVPSDI